MTDSYGQSGASIAYDWWRELNPAGGVRSGRQRAALARLRRAATPIEIMLEPEALRLLARLRRDPDRIAVLIGVLAFVRGTDEGTVARTVGRNALDDDQRQPVLAEGRFRRLLQVPPGELMDPMRRLVRMAGGTVNVRALSYAILNWGDSVKKRWIFDYYGVDGRVGSETDAAAPRADATLNDEDRRNG